MDTELATAADGQQLVVASPLRAGAGVPLSRRNVLKLGFWTAIGAAAVSAGVSFVNTLYPRVLEPFGGPVGVPASAVPKPGAPPLANFDGHFLLVNLAKGEGRAAGDETPAEGGLVALWWKCPHLGCTVPWRGDFVSPADPLGRRGWFACPCHGSTYTKAGVRIFGPAPRSMDTMQIDVNAKGQITVQTGKRTTGGPDNPQRAVPWTPPS
jgi:cytochrome b6-f complex iron-sulfur subunit